MNEEGTITTLEHRIFKDKEGTSIDHTKRRPVIIICDDGNDFYYLTISSKKSKYDRNFIYNTDTKIDCSRSVDPKVAILDTPMRQYINYTKIYSKEVCFVNSYYNLEDREYLNLLIKVYNYHQKRNTPEFKKIELSLLNQIKNYFISSCFIGGCEEISVSFIRKNNNRNFSAFFVFFYFF